MTRDQRWDTLRQSGIGKGKWGVNPLRKAMMEFESLETGLGQFQIPFLPQAPPSQFPIQRAPLVTRAPLPIARPRSQQEIETQAKAAEKPGIVQQILTPITNIAVIGIGAIVFVNVVPPLLDFLSRSRQRKE